MINQSDAHGTITFKNTNPLIIDEIFKTSSEHFLYGGLYYVGPTEDFFDPTFRNKKEKDTYGPFQFMSHGEWIFKNAFADYCRQLVLASNTLTPDKLDGTVMIIDYYDHEPESQWLTQGQMTVEFVKGTEDESQTRVKHTKERIFDYTPENVRDIMLELIF